MSLHVDKKSMMFDELTIKEASELLREVSQVVLLGTPCYDSPFFEHWAATLGYDGSQRLLVMSVAYPQRALLSVIQARYLHEFGHLEEDLAREAR